MVTKSSFIKWSQSMRVFVSLYFYLLTTLCRPAKTNNHDWCINIPVIRKKKNTQLVTQSEYFANEEHTLLAEKRKNSLQHTTMITRWNGRKAPCTYQQCARIKIMNLITSYKYIHTHIHTDRHLESIIIVISCMFFFRLCTWINEWMKN
jgi:hypothetical protein